MSETMRLVLWYSFGISTTVANLILAFKLPLKEIIKRRKRKLLVTGRTAREKAFELGDEKNQGNSELPKQLGVQVTAYEREVSLQRREAIEQIKHTQSKKMLRSAMSKIERDEANPNLAPVPRQQKEYRSASPEPVESEAIREAHYAKSPTFSKSSLAARIRVRAQSHDL